MLTGTTCERSKSEGRSWVNVRNGLYANVWHSERHKEARMGFSPTKLTQGNWQIGEGGDYQHRTRSSAADTISVALTDP